MKLDNFITYNIRTIVFIFIDIFTTFRLMLIQSSERAPEFYMKHLKKAEGRIARNVGNITMEMNTIVEIF